MTDTQDTFNSIGNSTMRMIESELVEVTSSKLENFLADETIPDPGPQQTKILG